MYKECDEEDLGWAALAFQHSFKYELIIRDVTIFHGHTVNSVIPMLTQIDRNIAIIKQCSMGIKMALKLCTIKLSKMEATRNGGGGWLLFTSLQMILGGAPQTYSSGRKGKFLMPVSSNSAHEMTLQDPTCYP